MPDKATVTELFDLAIAAEKAAEELYHKLEAMFAHHREVADFWSKYATEEAKHALWLKRIRDTSSPEQLSAPADPRVLQDARKILQFSIENRLQDIENLEDAYQLVIELENSETNAIFEFLVNHFASDDKTQCFLKSQLNEHIARLTTDFPTQFKSAANRRAVEVLKKDSK